MYLALLWHPGIAIPDAGSFMKWLWFCCSKNQLGMACRWPSMNSAGDYIETDDGEVLVDTFIIAPEMYESGGLWYDEEFRACLPLRITFQPLDAPDTPDEAHVLNEAEGQGHGNMQPGASPQAGADAQAVADMRHEVDNQDEADAGAESGDDPEPDHPAAPGFHPQAGGMGTDHAKADDRPDSDSDDSDTDFESAVLLLYPGNRCGSHGCHVPPALVRGGRWRGPDALHEARCGYGHGALFPLTAYERCLGLSDSLALDAA